MIYVKLQTLTIYNSNMTNIPGGMLYVGVYIRIYLYIYIFFLNLPDVRDQGKLLVWGQLQV